MKFSLFFLALFSLNISAETIQIGAYSGRVGYFANLGVEYKLKVNAIAMNEEVAKKLITLPDHGLGGFSTCEVSGLQQEIGYTIFKIKNCK
jgi:hypothetical protein